jgi:hypothetical protein
MTEHSQRFFVFGVRELLYSEAQSEANASYIYIYRERERERERERRRRSVLLNKWHSWNNLDQLLKLKVMGKHR